MDLIIKNCKFIDETGEFYIKVENGKIADISNSLKGLFNIARQPAPEIPGVLMAVGCMQKPGLSTAISIGKSFLNDICLNKKSYPQKACILCISSVIISNFGFSNLVKFLFPIFGYLGIFQLLLIIKFKK